MEVFEMRERGVLSGIGDTAGIDDFTPPQAPLIAKDIEHQPKGP